MNMKHTIFAAAENITMGYLFKFSEESVCRLKYPKVAYFFQHISYSRENMVQLADPLPVFVDFKPVV